MPHVHQTDAVPGRIRAWECEEAAGSEVSDVVQCQQKAALSLQVVGVVETYYPSDEEVRQWAGVQTDQLSPRIQWIHLSRPSQEVVASPLRENLGEGYEDKTSHPLCRRCRVSRPGKEVCFPGALMALLLPHGGGWVVSMTGDLNAQCCSQTLQSSGLLHE